MPDLKPVADLDLEALKRDELDKVAAEVGVPNPGKLPNKDAVIDAIEAPNPALAPVPDPDDAPRDRGYVVTGPHGVLGYAPGDTFTATIPAEQEAFLIEVGHLKHVNREGQE